MMTVVMLTLIAIGLILALAALVYVAVVAYRLYRVAQAAETSIQQPLNEITRRQATTLELTTRIEQRQALIEMNLAALSKSGQELNYLQSELAGAVRGLVGRDS
jgi:hypothetical protein